MGLRSSDEHSSPLTPDDWRYAADAERRVVVQFLRDAGQEKLAVLVEVGVHRRQVREKHPTLVPWWMP